MGNAIWIFIGIAIIQAIVGGIAKSAEKRKKAEAAQRMLEEAQAGGAGAPAPARSANAVKTAGPKPAVASDTRNKSNSSAQRRLEELRKKRLEVLRRRSGPDAGVTAAIDPNARRARAAVTTPPPAVAPTRAPVPARGASARVAEAKERRASTPPARAAQKTRRETRKADQERRSDRQSARTPTRSPGTRNAGPSHSTAKNLRGRLRTSKGFREALLLGELLKPPVGLRSPGGGPA
ncbi:MAG: hypothetical protein P8I44_13165 [Phycisphaerales bacterium]|nr:hypothetical protein [Phycisphaerales bacterium]